ncbi:UDP-N-acetylenolpyruvoylglucosamine reductase [Shouchella clausii]|nr:UDP-N-acetylmuramate dehydrogenase [Shouchella clausii]AST95781.1 UDP-N-acetylenolpyruvoylglucosamine reductase [Shouchella clausii]MCR1289258.1 UDP-N-acetylmuramate dehydrogenase [Shouchella clausii]MEB5472189.1 UDP-N-acetylmuramate dehydrogenase [Shouchella clausii]QNM42135.1 UDP-N-acetylmuramate dehydrogenase [Shouchella clausii]WQG95031.1 UDP-N-acetylmuramate dehydrogenase [Shouchella clausii]
MMMKRYIEVCKPLWTLLPEGTIHENERLCKHTYTQMGGAADLFITPQSYEETQTVLKFAHEHRVPVTLLGNGSNVIVKDGGIRGITLSLKKLNTITCTGAELVAQTGATIIEASRRARDAGLTGLEFACGIPGTVGGAFYMNAGAYGGQIADVLESVLVLTEQGEFKTLSKEEFDFDYRKSVFSAKRYIALEGTFRLQTGDKAQIQAKMDELTIARETKQPLEYPSCGSVFKRPPGMFAGKLIQDSGLQGTRIGGAEVSKKHAGFIVNVDNATATEYMSLVRHVQQTVKDKFGVELETEVITIGEDLEEPVSD